MKSESISQMEELCEKLSKQRNSTVIPLLMDETRSITHYLVSEVYDQIKSIEEQGLLKEDVDVILHSGGGDVDAAYHLGLILQGVCKGNLTIIIPRYAKSAATLLACSGNTIAMDLPSELGPIDPQIEDPTTKRWVSILSITKTIDFLKTLEKGPLLEELAKRIPVLEIGDYDRLIRHVCTCVEELLLRRMLKNDKNRKELASKIAKALTQKFQHHGMCIDISKAKEIGLKVVQLPPEQWKIVWKIFRIFEAEFLVD